MKYEENTVQRSLHSPGCNEGKARNETLGICRQKRIELHWSNTFGARICRSEYRPVGAQ